VGLALPQDRARTDHQTVTPEFQPGQRRRSYATFFPFSKNLSQDWSWDESRGNFKFPADHHQQFRQHGYTRKLFGNGIFNMVNEKKWNTIIE
jgi:hypothetical protein